MCAQLRIRKKASVHEAHCAVTRGLSFLASRLAFDCRFVTVVMLQASKTIRNKKIIIYILHKSQCFPLLFFTMEKFLIFG